MLWVEDTTDLALAVICISKFPDHNLCYRYDIAFLLAVVVAAREFSTTRKLRCSCGYITISELVTYHMNGFEKIDLWLHQYCC
jgi:hypothetical protein